MPDIFDEVAEDLRAERARALLIRYGGLLAVAAVAVILGTAAWQLWQWQANRRLDRVASTYLEAMQHSDPGATTEHAQAIDLYAKIDQTNFAGYRSLSRLREAALKADAGDQAGALALWDQTAQDSHADPLLRELASLMWAEHQIDHGDPATVAARLQTLATPDSPFHGLAQEAQALLALRQGHVAEAKKTLERLSIDADVPDGVRGRANMLLAGIGG